MGNFFNTLKNKALGILNSDPFGVTPPAPSIGVGNFLVQEPQEIFEATKDLITGAFHLKPQQQERKTVEVRVDEKGTNIINETISRPQDKPDFLDKSLVQQVFSPEVSQRNVDFFKDKFFAVRNFLTPTPEEAVQQGMIAVPKLGSANKNDIERLKAGESIESVFEGRTAGFIDPFAAVGGLRITGQKAAKTSASFLSKETSEYLKSLTKKNSGVFSPISSLRNKTASFLREAKTKLVDFTAPIEDVLREASKKNKFTLLPSANIHNQIDRVLRANTIAGQFAKDRGLVDVIKLADDVDILDQYLIAKHAITLESGGVRSVKFTPELKPLAAEARKYKSAEEFVRAQAGNQKIYTKEYNAFTQENRLTAKPFDYDLMKNAIGSEPETKGNLVKVYRLTDAKSEKLLPGDNVSIYNPRTLSDATLAKMGFVKLKNSGQGRIIEQWISKEELYQTSAGTQLYAPNGIKSLTDFYNQATQTVRKRIATGRNLDKDAQMLKELAPQYEVISQRVTQYSRDLLDYSVDAGLVSKELAKRLKEIYPNYVPFNRVFDEIEKSGGTFGGKAVASLSKQTIVQRIQGSERQIESPIASLLAKTHDAFLQGERNKAAKLLASYRNLPDNPFGLVELPKGRSAAHTISFLDEGVKRTFEAPKEIAEAAKALDVQRLNIFGQIMAAPVRLAKLGITGVNLPFVGANVVRDQTFGFINSRAGLRSSVANPGVFLKALFNAVKHDEVYEQMIREGAGFTSFDIARNAPKQTVERIRAGRNVGSRIKYTATHPQELLRAVEDIVSRSEELARLQQFEGAKRAALKAGLSEKEALVEAARNSREASVNFARRGEWGTVMNSAFLYINAGIQGGRTMLGSLRDRPIQTATKLAVALYTPIAVTTAWNLSDPKRKEVYDDIADYEKENNLIIIPPNPTKDEKSGKWNVIKIPITPGLSKLGIPVRRGMEQAYGANKIAFGDIANTLTFALPFDILQTEQGKTSVDVGSIASTGTPQAIQPSLEFMTNTNFFTGFNQVPQSMEKLSPELQVKDNTSGTARVIGGVVDKSPIKIEEFIKGTGGGVASQILNVSDRVLAGLDIIPKDQIGGQNVIEAIAARFTKARGGEKEQESVQEIKDLLTKQADERFRIKQEAELLFDELSNLPKEEANAKAREIKKANPALYEKLKDVKEEFDLGLTYEERLIKQLGVENGERARFIWNVLEQVDSREEKNALIKSWREKKIISTNVFEQLKKLKAGLDI